MIGHPPAAQDTSCPLCGKTDSRILFRGVTDYLTGEDFEVRRCQACSVGYTWPQPESLSQFYPAQYRAYGGLTSKVLSYLYGKRARQWARMQSHGGRALEIGCGHGWLLQALHREGWTVVGSERTLQSAASAARDGAVPVFVGELEAVKENAGFDLIILFQVLEHLPDPAAVLSRCATLLKPGGMVLVGVPNLESWQARATGSNWFHLDVPRHLFHFSLQSLCSLLGRAGLRCVRVRYASMEHDPYGWTQSLLNVLGFPPNRLTRSLMGLEREGLKSPIGLIVAITAGLLAVPSLLLATASWFVGAGACLEVLAIKPPEPPPGAALVDSREVVAASV